MGSGAFGRRVTTWSSQSQRCAARGDSQVLFRSGLHHQEQPPHRRDVQGPVLRAPQSIFTSDSQQRVPIVRPRRSSRDVRSLSAGSADSQRYARLAASFADGHIIDRTAAHRRSAPPAGSNHETRRRRSARRRGFRTLKARATLQRVFHFAFLRATSRTRPFFATAPIVSASSRISACSCW